MTITIKNYPYNKETKEVERLSLPLFFSFVSDHVLTGDEAKGWALQGSLVTSEYPDAVSRIKNEYSKGIAKTYTLGSYTVAYKLSNGFKIADISQKNTVDNLFKTYAAADFYILDSVNNRFYLPRNANFIQLTTDVSKVNNFIEAGLPNITGKAGYIDGGGYNPAASGVFYLTDTVTNHGRGTTNSQHTMLNFNASRSSNVYGKSKTVQPPASYKLLYYKV